MSVGLIEACHAFGITTSGVTFGNGHINSTFIAKKDGEDYVLQLINTNVFKNPVDMISNIRKITKHIKKKIKEDGGDPKREVINLLKSNEGSYVFCASTGEAYRAYRFIDDSVTLEGSATPDEFYQAGYGFGKFQKYLSNFPADELYETIPDFQRKFENAPYFCLPHYRRMLEYAGAKMNKRVFREFYKVAHSIQEKYITSLKGDVSWFCKKFDYRYDEEPWYNSKDSVQRSIKFLASDFGHDE